MTVALDPYGHRWFRVRRDGQRLRPRAVMGRVFVVFWGGDMRGPVLSVAIGVVLALVSAASAAAQAPACDPFTTPVFREQVPTAGRRSGFPSAIAT